MESFALAVVMALTVSCHFLAFASGAESADRNRICREAFDKSKNASYSSAIGAIHATKSGSQQVSTGTGFLVSKDLIVTAAHVVLDDQEIYDEIYFGPDLVTNLDKKKWGLRLEVVKIGNNPSSSNEDWAILRILPPESRQEELAWNRVRLTEPIAIRPWEDSILETTKNIRVVGYPKSCKSGDERLMTSFDGVLTRSVNWYYRLRFWMRNVQGIFTTEFGIGSGMSGGPVLIMNSSGTWESIGIHVIVIGLDQNVNGFVYSSSFQNALDELLNKK